MSTAAILPGFILPAVGTAQPGTASALSAAAFSDLLSAFTGTGQNRGGQGQEDHNSSDPEAAPDQVSHPVSGLGQLGGWSLPNPAAEQQQFLPLPGLEVPATTAEAPASGLEIRLPAEPSTEAGAGAYDSPASVQVLVATGQAPQVHRPTSEQKTATPPDVAPVIAPLSAAAFPVEAPARPTSPAAAPGGAGVPAQVSDQAPAPVAATTAVIEATSTPAVFLPAQPASPVIRAALSPQLAVAIATESVDIAVPAPAAQPVAVPTQDAMVDTPATSPSSEPAVPASAEVSTRTQETIIQPGQPVAAEAPKAAGPVPAASVPAAPATPQPMAAQLARPLFTLATESAGEHVVTMKVSPEDLGPVTVRAHISSEGVRLEMFAAGEAGRDAVRAALPELRRELALQGLAASLDLSGRNSPEHGQPQPQQHRGSQDQGGPYRANLRMVTEAEPTPGQPVRTLSSTAALDVVA